MLNTIEEWRRIAGYEAFYEVSNLGRVKRLRSACGTQPGRILRPQRVTSGYVTARLHKYGRGTAIFIHKLVAEAFLGPRPVGYVCNHKSGVKDDNRLANLEWVTPSTNNLHALANGLATPTRGERHGRSKLRESQVIEILRLCRAGNRQADVARQFGVSTTAIYEIVHGMKWAHIHSREVHEAKQAAA
jgi:hypothetical protein